MAPLSGEVNAYTIFFEQNVKTHPAPQTHARSSPLPTPTLFFQKKMSKNGEQR